MWKPHPQCRIVSKWQYFTLLLHMVCVLCSMLVTYDELSVFFSHLGIALLHQRRFGERLNFHVIPWTPFSENGNNRPNTETHYHTLNNIIIGIEAIFDSPLCVFSVFQLFHWYQPLRSVRYSCCIINTVNHPILLGREHEKRCIWINHTLLQYDSQSLAHLRETKTSVCKESTSLRYMRQIEKPNQAHMIYLMSVCISYWAYNFIPTNL